MAYKENNSGVFLSDALELFNKAKEADRDQRIKAVEDLLFVNAEDGQWDEIAKEKREDKPRYTINRIAGAIDQLVGDQRQNRVSSLVQPQKDGDEKIAKVFTGLIRSIEQISSATNSYDNAYTEQTTCGYGAWRIKTEHSNDDSFDQEIKIEAINSAASTLYFDPSAKAYDCRDAAFAFLTTRISKQEFERKYPDATPVDVAVENLGTTDHISTWYADDTVMIAEYWYKCPCKKKIGLLSDGRTIDLDEEKAVLDELAAQGITVTREREVEAFDIKMAIISGAEVLEAPQEWAGKFIPLVPVYGKVSYIEDKKYVRGIVRLAKDAQRIYNYAVSAAIEASAQTPKDPIWITATQSKGFESDLKTFNTRNTPFMRYNADPSAPGPPSRGGAPQLQQALMSQIEQAKNDVYATTGIEPASLGSVPVLKSGRAIQAEQNMGDRGAFIFQDNLRKSISYSAEIMVDLMPKIYDNERVVQTLGFDEAMESVEINKSVFDEFNQPIIDEETGEEVIVNDLSKGKYSVVSKSGPSFSTKKQETVNQLLDFASTAPEFQALASDLIVKNMDINHSEEIVKRVRAQMIKNGIVEPTEEEIKELKLDQQPPEDPMNAELVKNLQAQTEQTKVKTQEIIAKVDKMEAETQQTIISAQKDSTIALTNILDVFLKKIEANIPLQSSDLDLMEGQEALVAETQENVIEHGELAGSMPAGIPPQQVVPEPLPPQPLEPPMEQPPVLGITQE